MNDFPPLIDSRCGVKGLFYYGSAYVCSAQGGGSRMQAQIRRVYDFKKWRHNSEMIEELVRLAADKLECSEIWAMPSSTMGTVNSLQSLFGVSIERVKDAEKRKYNHHAQVDISGLVFPQSAKGTVLLVDDVCTTGRSLIVVAAELSRLKIDCRTFCVGLNKKIVMPNAPTPEAIEEAFQAWKQSKKIVETEGIYDEKPDMADDGVGVFDVSALLGSLTEPMPEEDDGDDLDRILAIAENESVSPEQRLKNIVELVKARQ